MVYILVFITKKYQIWGKNGIVYASWNLSHNLYSVWNLILNIIVYKLRNNASLLWLVSSILLLWFFFWLNKNEYNYFYLFYFLFKTKDDCGSVITALVSHVTCIMKDACVNHFVIQWFILIFHVIWALNHEINILSLACVLCLQCLSSPFNLTPAEMSSVPRS